jgi:hypothetical protein
MVPIGAAVEGGSRMTKIRHAELGCVPGAADRRFRLTARFVLAFRCLVHRYHCHISQLYQPKTRHAPMRPRRFLTELYN